MLEAQVATVSGAGAPVIALQQSIGSGSSEKRFFCSTADGVVSVYSAAGGSCTLVRNTKLPTRAVALESLPGRVVCGQANGDIMILCEVRTYSDHRRRFSASLALSVHLQPVVKSPCGSRHECAGHFEH